MAEKKKKVKKVFEDDSETSVLFIEAGKLLERFAKIEERVLKAEEKLLPLRSPTGYSYSEILRKLEEESKVPKAYLSDLLARGFKVLSKKKVREVYGYEGRRGYPLYYRTRRSRDLRGSPLIAYPDGRVLARNPSDEVTTNPVL